MPKALSEDLRRRVVEAHRAGQGSYAEVAARFGVGVASVSRWLRLRRESGAVAPRPRAGRSPKLGAEGQRALRSLVDEHADATLAELARLLEARAGVRLGASTLHKALGRLGISRKKKTSTRPSATATRRAS